MSGPEILLVGGDSEKHVARVVAKALKAGSLVIVPTDTVYGIAADPSTVDWQSKIYRAKSRDGKKPIPLLISDVNAIEQFGGRLASAERALAKAFWPGPLTLVVECGHEQGGTEGFRVPDHSIMLMILQEVGGALRVTSANTSGEPAALTVEDALRTLSPFVDIAVNAGRSAGGIASTVVRVERDGKGVHANVLREGAISSELIADVVRQSSGGPNA